MVLYRHWHLDTEQPDIRVTLVELVVCKKILLSDSMDNQNDLLINNSVSMEMIALFCLWTEDKSEEGDIIEQGIFIIDLWISSHRDFKDAILEAMLRVRIHTILKSMMLSSPSQHIQSSDYHEKDVVHIACFLIDCWSFLLLFSSFIFSATSWCRLVSFLFLNLALLPKYRKRMKLCNSN